MILNGFSCRCGARTGSKAIGVFFLVVTILALLSLIPGWVVIDKYESVHHLFLVRYEADYKELWGKLWLGGDQLRSVMIALTVLLLLDLIFNSMLVHGVSRDSPRLLLAWLVYHGLKFTLASLAGLALVIAGILLAAIFASNPMFQTHFSAVSAVLCGGLGQLLISALLWTWWAIVYTHRRQLMEQFVSQREVQLKEVESPYRASAPAWDRSVPAPPEQGMWEDVPRARPCLEPA